MESETSRSSGSADSYIGSLISLTSKSEIRYEGVLFEINTAESSIGLRNVRSYGTEGCRKDGPQIPASDTVYEFIVFRGSDIKDLQVKSSPPVQNTPPVHNDPAIIQSQYAAAKAQSSLPIASSSSAPESLSDPSNQTQSGVPKSSFQNNIPLYPPGGGLAPWNVATPNTADGSGLSVPPVYWQGYYGPSGGLQTPQQPLLRPGHGLSMQLPSVQQPVQHTTMNLSLSGGTHGSTSQSMEFRPPLLQPIVSNNVSMQSALDSSMNVMPSKAPAQVVPAVSQNSNPSFVSPGMPNVLDKSNVATLIPNQGKSISTPSMPFNSVSESLSAVAGTSPAFVTPGQFLQHGSTMSLTSHNTVQNEVEVVQVSSVASQSQPLAMGPATVVATLPSESQAPLLPLPSSSNPKINEVTLHNHYVNHGGPERGRGNELAHAKTSFAEEFDFEAMNEKFKKDEVWGHLGKSKSRVDDELDSQDEDEINIPKIDVKPIYKKDDFFDTLSCNALDHDSHNGRPRFSEQRRLDTETFGDFSRNHGYRGGRGPGRSGRSRGGYYGRGYGYTGRGRGYNMYRPL